MSHLGILQRRSPSAHTLSVRPLLKEPRTGDGIDRLVKDAVARGLAQYEVGPGLGCGFADAVAAVTPNSVSATSTSTVSFFTISSL